MTQGSAQPLLEESLTWQATITGCVELRIWTRYERIGKWGKSQRKSRKGVIRSRDEKRGALRRKEEMKVKGRRKRGRPKRRWLDRVRDDIKEKGLSAVEVYDRAT